MSPVLTRRVISGHDPSGRAIFTHDETLPSLDPVTKQPSDGSGVSMTLIHRTTGFPVTNQGGVDELDISNLQRTKPDGTLKGIVVEVVTIPPSKPGTDFPMHRNTSLDYGVIMKGSVVLELDDGVETTLHEGDVYIQRGTVHAWKNVTNEDCRFLTVILPSEKVVVEKTGEVLGSSKLAGLTE